MLFAVVREAGAGWDGGRALRDQDGWDEHAAFMDALAEEGFILLGGPIGTGVPMLRVLLIIDAESEAAIHARLEQDPWTPTQVLKTASIEAWNVLLGAVPSAGEATEPA
jgi:uncharacterized protein YciI